MKFDDDFDKDPETFQSPTGLIMGTFVVVLAVCFGVALFGSIPASRHDDGYESADLLGRSAYTPTTTQRSGPSTAECDRRAQAVIHLCRVQGEPACTREANALIAECRK